MGCFVATPSPADGLFPGPMPFVSPPSRLDSGPFAAVNDPGIEGRKFRNAPPTGLIGVVPDRREPSGSDPEHTPTGIWQPDRRRFAPH